MKKTLIIFLWIFFLSVAPLWAAGTCGSSANGGTNNCTGTNPWTADTHDLVDVEYCVQTCSTYGDTVNVPAGDGAVSWADELNITKHITLAGPGLANLIIDNTGLNNCQHALIRYAPDSTSMPGVTNEYGGWFEVTGFTFQNTGYLCATTSKGILVYGNDTGTANKYYRNIRIHDNKFLYFGYYYHGEAVNWANYGNPIAFWEGNWAALIDHNYFWGTDEVRTGEYADEEFAAGTIWSKGKDNGWEEWQSAEAPGSVDAIYVEDNHIKNFGGDGLVDGSWGQRIVYRFNEVSDPNQMPFGSTTDSHGNTWGVVFPASESQSITAAGVTVTRGTRLQEVYGNKYSLQLKDGTTPTRSHLASTRGGHTYYHNNRFFELPASADVRIYAYEEDCLATREAAPHKVTRGGVVYEALQDHTASTGNGPPNAAYWKTPPDTGTDKSSTWTAGAIYKADHGYDPIQCYQWSNINNTDESPYRGGTTGRFNDNDPCGLVDANEDYWEHNASFNGTAGVGIGTRALRPATCTAGVLYWSTDQGTWNGSSGTDGLHNPLGVTTSGVGDKCTATNTWNAGNDLIPYYTPYTYPHPLQDYTAPGDAENPTCTVTTNGGANYSTETAQVTIEGTATDNAGVSSVTWACVTSTPASGTATGTTSWSFSAVLDTGENVFTVTATDPSSNTGQDIITITKTAATAFGGSVGVGTGTGSMTKGSGGYFGW